MLENVIAAIVIDDDFTVATGRGRQEKAASAGQLHSAQCQRCLEVPPCDRKFRHEQFAAPPSSLGSWFFLGAPGSFADDDHHGYRVLLAVSRRYQDVHGLRVQRSAAMGLYV